MKIVVIGGTGLIGSKAVAILRQGGPFWKMRRQRYGKNLP
jgi:hypothetical protein